MINSVICGSCNDVLRTMEDDFVDMTLTSPPYDNLRTYDNKSMFDFEDTAKQLFRVTKPGGVVVWVVGDETYKFCESLSSFKQAIYFAEVCGFKLLDTMIYHKTSGPPMFPGTRRYRQAFEYMFVLSKGKPSTFNKQKVPKIAPSKKGSMSSYRQRDGSLKKKRVTAPSRMKAISNVWSVNVGSVHTTKDKYAFEHPALMPESIAKLHVLTWSNEGDIILDPFAGAGTTLKIAKQNGRRFIGVDINEDYCKLARRRVNE